MTIKFEWYQTNWAGFEFENPQGKWRVLHESVANPERPWILDWRCESVEINPDETMTLDSDGCDLFNHHQLMGFYIEQLEAQLAIGLPDFR